MASIRKEANGRKRILVVCPDGRRRSIRLGKVDMKQAETARVHVEHLVGCVAGGTQVSRTTAEWVSRTTEDIRDKLKNCGLIEIAARRRMSLKEYLNLFHAARSSEIKERTKLNFEVVKDRLIEHFGEECRMDSIDPIAAARFKVWMETTSNKRDSKRKGLSPNTVRRRLGLCRQIFSQAIEDEVIDKNPFRKFKTKVGSNEDRKEYVDLERFYRVLEHAPNAKWRAMLVLGRIAALRMPSEAAKLKWEHINWDAKRIYIIGSSKTEHHDKRKRRVVPMLPDVERELLRLFAEAPDGAEFVFPNVRQYSNIGQQLGRIIRRAGVQPWPKIWQNLRASGATDFARTSPKHVATAICGHTEEIAQEHYWQVTDTDLDDLTGKLDRAHKCAHENLKSAQNCAQQTSAPKGQSSAVDQAIPTSNATFPNVSGEPEVPRKGLKLEPETLEKPPSSADSPTLRPRSSVCTPSIESIASDLSQLAQSAEHLGHQALAVAIREAQDIANTVE